MSEDYSIGLSRAQILNLLAGKEQGKRPYAKSVRGKPRYAEARVHIRMLTPDERAKEPDAAFNWPCYVGETEPQRPSCPPDVDCSNIDCGKCGKLNERR